MASGDVRALRVDLKLTSSQMKKEVAAVRADLRLLQAEFKNTEGDRSLSDAADVLKANLQSQIDAVDRQVSVYEARIATIKKALTEALPGSKQEAGLLGDLKSVETSLAGAQDQLNVLQGQLNDFDLSAFQEAMGQVVDLTQNLDMAYNGLIGDWAEETADAADEIFVERERMDALVRESLGRDATEADINRLKQWGRDLISSEIPVTYEELASAEKAIAEGGFELGEGLEEMTVSFLKLKAVAESVTGEEGAAQLSQIARLTGVAKDEFSALGSTVAALGNASNATEADILEMTDRTASAGGVFGIAAGDLLAFSAASASFGMENEAGGSAIARTLQDMGTAAEYAGGGYTELLETIQALYPEYENVYAFMVAAEQKAAMINELATSRNQTPSDVQDLIDKAILLEKYSNLMGMSAMEFGKAWEKDAGEAYLSFWKQLSLLNESGMISAFEALGMVDVKNIRTTLLALNYTSMADYLQEYVDIADEAWASADELDARMEELNKAEANQRIFRQNIRENMMEGVGEGVTAMRKPFDDFFADIQKRFTEDLPDWVLEGAGAVVNSLGAIGNLITGVGDVAEGIYYSGEVIGKIKNINWGRIGGALAPIATGTLGAASAAGFVALMDYITGLSHDAESIRTNLGDIRIHVDEESAEQALAEIEKIQAASDKLSGDETERYEGAAAAVRAGLGDAALFGQALGYEQRKAEQALNDLALSYGRQIDETNQAIVAANEAGDLALAQTLTERREALRSAWSEEKENSMDEYSRAVSALFQGMIEQDEALRIRAERAGQAAPLFSLLLGLEGGTIDRTVDNMRRAFDELAAAGLISQEDAKQRIFNIENGGPVWTDDFREYIDDLIKTMGDDLKAILGDEQIGAYLQTMVEGGILEGMDVSQTEGALWGIMQTILLNRFAQQEGTYEGIAEALAKALGEGGNLTGEAVNALRDAIIEELNNAFDDESVSGAASGAGYSVTASVADGILAGKAGAVEAMREVMSAVAAEAEAYTPRISALMSFGGGGYAPTTGSSPLSRGSGTIIQNYSFTGANVQTQQGIRKLAQEIARVQKKTNSSVGMG